MSIIARLPQPVSLAVGKQLFKTQKASPTLLFVGGVVGVVATAVMASRATMQIEPIIDRASKDLQKINTIHETVPGAEYDEKDAVHDKVIVYSRTAVDIAKLYTPTVLIGVASIAALTGSHVMLTRRNAAITAAYAALDQGFREYRKRVVDEYGEDVDRRFRYSNDEVKVRDTKSGEIVKNDPALYKMDPNKYSIYARFFDELSSSWNPEPEYNNLFLRCQQNYVNDLLNARGHVFLNEVYDRLGIPRSKAGAVVGWTLHGEGDGYIDFGIFDGWKPKVRPGWS